MNILIIYRNYIPLYSGYCSFWLSKIKNINFIIPKTNSYKKFFYQFYKYFKRYNFLINNFYFFGKLLFSSKPLGKYDVFFYAGLIPIKVPQLPYIIDFEHIISLFDYGKITEASKQKVISILSNPKCLAILPWSRAALKTMEQTLGKNNSQFKNKIEILYPALPIYKYIYKADNSIVSKNKILKILFVGRDYKRKGLLELLAALKIINLKHDFEFWCISNYKPYKNKSSSNYHFLPANFEQNDIITKFFLTCDLLVLPTSFDTFGMVILEALSSGMPVITTNIFAIKEIIKNEYNGLLLNSSQSLIDKDPYLNTRVSNLEKNYKLNSQIIKQLVDKISQLIKNPKLLAKLKQNTIKDFLPNGKFSIEKRNQVIEKICSQI